MIENIKNGKIRCVTCSKNQKKPIYYESSKFTELMQKKALNPNFTQTLCIKCNEKRNLAERERRKAFIYPPYKEFKLYKKFIMGPRSPYKGKFYNFDLTRNQADFV